MKIRSLLAASALLFAAHAQAQVIINNFDGINSFPLSATGGSSGTVGEFWGIPGDNQFRITSGTSANFAQYAKTPVFAANSGILTTFSQNTSFQLDYRVYQSDNATATTPFTLRLAYNTNSGYVGLTQISLTVPASGFNSGTFTVNYGSNTAFMTALNNYRSGTGTFFEFYLDNSGFPGISSPVTFSIDNVRVVPEPSTIALITAGLACALFFGRRRRNA